MAPVAQRVEVAEVQAVLQAKRDAGQRARDLARDEGLAAQRRLVVEQDAVAGVHAVRLAVVDGDPVGVELGHRVRAARVERRRLALRGLLHEAVELAGAGLVEAAVALQAEQADRLEQSQRAQRVDVGGVLRALEADRDMAHRAEVVDLVGAHLLHDADQVGAVGEVAVVQDEPAVALVRVLVEVVDALGVERRGAALDAVHRVTLGQQQLGEVGAVLPGDAGDQRDAATGGRGRGAHRTTPAAAGPAAAASASALTPAKRGRCSAAIAATIAAANSAWMR